MTEITEKDLLEDMILSDDKDWYFFNFSEDYGFRIHRTIYNNLVAVKRTKKTIKPVPLHEFLDCYNKNDAFNNVSADCFYNFLPF